MASLMAKRDEICGHQTLFRETGYYITRLRQYEHALKFFDQALEKYPEDKRALIGRSKACAMACHYRGALEDINKALKLYPDDLLVLANKALNTYLGCHFEESLVENIRLAPVRKKPDYFKMGIMHCTDAIENCIGKRAGKPLRDHFKIIRQMAWQKNFDDQQKSFKGKTRGQKKVQFDKDEVRDTLHSQVVTENIVPPFFKNFPCKPEQNYTSNIENYMSEKYLDSLYLDKLFLKNLQEHPAISCPNKEGSLKLQKLASEGFKDVDYKQHLLRTRRPFYFLKHQESKSKGGLLKRQNAELLRQQEAAADRAHELFKKMRSAHQEKNYKNIFSFSEELRNFVMEKHLKILPTRKDYLQQIFKCLCFTYYSIFRLRPSHTEEEKHCRIRFVFRLPRLPSDGQSTDSIIQHLKQMHIDYKKEVEKLEKRLPTCTLTSELALVNYELAFCHFKLNHFELSRSYARKCIQQGKDGNFFRWVVLGTTILTRISMAQKNINDAKNHLQNILKIAKENEDEELEEFVKTSLLVFDNIDYGDIVGFKALEKREQTIINLMPTPKMKEQAAHLFRMMAAMPASRRMILIPGVQLDHLENFKQKHGRRSIKIVDNEPSEAARMPRKKRNSTVSQANRGYGFLELIQHHID